MTIYFVAKLHHRDYTVIEVITMTIGDRMKNRRKELGYTAEYIAEKLGVSRATIFRYENGSVERLPIDVLWPLSRALDTTPAYLMGWEDEEENIKAPDGESGDALGDKFSMLFDQLDEDQQKAIVMQLEWLLSKQ